VRARRASGVVWAALAAVAVAACGLSDSAQVQCLCTEDTDRTLYPDCVEADEVSADNPLSTRLPECPSGALLFLREPTDPEAVLFNVRDTFEGFSPTQYMDQLTEDFLFAPDLDGLQLYLEVFRPPAGYNPDPPDLDTLWAREAERRFALNLIDRQRFQRIQFTRWYDASEDERILDADNTRLETYVFPYALRLLSQPDNAGVVTVTAVRGEAEVDLVTPSDENPVWAVRRWQDFPGDAAADSAATDSAARVMTFTELRGANAQ